MDAPDLHVFEAAQERHKGTCVVTMHLGHLEMMVGYVTLHGFPVHVIYRDLNSKSVHDFGIWFERKPESKPAAASFEGSDP